MGFRTNAYATVWEIKPTSNTLTRGRISIDRKNKNTGEWEKEFSGYVAFIGTAAASKALNLKERDRIRLGDVDVSNHYDKEKNITYTDFKIFSFEDANGNNSGGTQTQQPVVGDPIEFTVDETAADMPF